MYQGEVKAGVANQSRLIPNIECAGPLQKIDGMSGRCLLLPVETERCQAVVEEVITRKLGAMNQGIVTEHTLGITASKMNQGVQRCGYQMHNVLRSESIGTDRKNSGIEIVWRIESVDRKQSRELKEW
jgi:hypothetical protein